LRRNLAAARLAVLSQLEYRINFTVDAVIQPILTSAIEVTLWMSILAGMSGETLGGFGREYYLAYALWANFMGRISVNWMYEFTMLDDIDTGKVNAILMRPISFYEFYLSQFVGYKLTVATASLWIPSVVCLIIGAPFHPERLPLMLALMICYLVFTHTLSFCVACMAFYMNRANALTGMKNLAIWVLAGELVPLDLYPEPLRSWLISLPFAAGVYLPVSYLTGRVGPEAMMNGFVSVAVGLVVVGAIAYSLWKTGVRNYAGTGA
jgi:ABC-2 type transport system permease protein